MNYYSFVAFIHRSDDYLLLRKNGDNSLSFPTFPLPHKIRNEQEVKEQLNIVSTIIKPMDTVLMDKPYIKTISVRGLPNKSREILETFIVFAEKNTSDGAEQDRGYEWVPLRMCLTDKRIHINDRHFIEIYLNNQIARFD